MQRDQLPLLLSLLALAGLLATPALAAHPDFVEPDVTVLASHTAEAQGDFFGYVAAAAGDQNGDGVSEYLIGARFHSGPAFFSGKGYVYDGATGSLIHAVDGSAFAEVLGHSVAGGGDADGDGVPDYAFGGRAFSTTPGRVVLLSGADHSVIREYLGPPGAAFGHDIDFAGDLDGDGLDDLIVGARFDSTAGDGAGHVVVLSSADGSVIWQRFGEPGDSLGSAVSSLGDLDGDGVPEQGVGAAGRSKEIGQDERSGVTFVYSGASGALLHTLEPRPTAGNFGTFFVHDAGDHDRDGVNDVYVGDFSDSFAGDGAGAAYVYSGATGERLRFFTGEAAGDGFGIGRGAGDVDGDHFDDLVTAGYLNDTGAPNGGRCYVYSGRNGKVLRTYTLNVASGRLGFDTVPLGDVNGDGVGDYLLTGVDRAYVVSGELP